MGIVSIELQGKACGWNSTLTRGEIAHRWRRKLDCTSQQEASRYVIGAVLTKFRAPDPGNLGGIRLCEVCGRALRPEKSRGNFLNGQRPIGKYFSTGKMMLGSMWSSRRH